MKQWLLYFFCAFIAVLVDRLVFNRTDQHCADEQAYYTTYGNNLEYVAYAKKHFSQAQAQELSDCWLMALSAGCNNPPSSKFSSDTCPALLIGDVEWDEARK